MTMYIALFVIDVKSKEPHFNLLSCKHYYDFPKQYVI